MTHFDQYDIPLYPGKLIGVRAFSVNARHWLAGVAYPDVWHSGENTARCAIYDGSFASRSVGPAPEDHQVANRSCSCGYYAYFKGEDNIYGGPVCVEAVVEAWGKVTIGSRGFRASKAKILALVVPTYPSSWQDKLRHRRECPIPGFSAHAWSYPFLADKAGCSLPHFPFPQRVTQILSHYPNVATFETIQDATEAFPPTPVEVACKIVGVSE